MHARQTLALAVAAMAFAALGDEIDLREPNDGTRVLAAKKSGGAARRGVRRRC